jgi:EAL domain-containing protein (putative c-di-GMP-specific phosphodiesterase class I)
MSERSRGLLVGQKMLRNRETTIETLRQLRALGVRLAMDDFGTGHSSLSYLRNFPFDKIKIDRVFVHDLSSKKDSSAIVRAVSQLASSLGVERLEKAWRPKANSTS